MLFCSSKIYKFVFKVYFMEKMRPEDFEGSYMVDRIDFLKEVDAFNFTPACCDKNMDYSGTIGDVVTSLKYSFGLEGVEREKVLFLYTPRLLSGFIDYGLRTRSPFALGKKVRIEEFYMDVARGEYSKAAGKLESIRFSEQELQSKVLEDGNHISWAAFSPQFVSGLINQIEDNEDDVNYVIADGHDGYRPAMMVANYFGCPMIAVRNSQESRRDNCPRLMKGEAQRLEDLLYAARVLVLGEDVVTGNAINSLSRFIEDVADTKKVFTAAVLVCPNNIEPDYPDYYATKKTVF